MSSSYLSPQEDGLLMRQSRDYAKDKLRILQGYIYRFTTSMREKPWRSLFYLDLMAGPGKNIFSPSQEVMLGSPLIALTARYAFTHYRFVEAGSNEFAALQTRVSSSKRVTDVQIWNDDCNIVVDQIIEEIMAIDKQYIHGRWPSLNLAFLDPEGLELNWNTVEKLGKVNRMDLIINFSTSGFTRNVDQMIKKGQTGTLDEFFGTQEWQEVYKRVADRDATHVRRAMLDFYKERLTKLGYHLNREHEIVQEPVFQNRKRVQIYTLMFASKDDLGIEFWNAAVQEVSQPPLF